MTVAQLVEWSLPTLEVYISNPVIGKFLSILSVNNVEKTKLNKKRPGMVYFFKKTNMCQLRQWQRMNSCGIDRLSNNIVLVLLKSRINGLFFTEKSSTCKWHFCAQCDGCSSCLSGRVNPKNYISNKFCSNTILQNWDCANWSYQPNARGISRAVTRWVQVESCCVYEIPLGHAHFLH